MSLQSPDSRIALGVDTSPAPGPFQTLGALMQIKEQQEIMKARQQEEEARRRALEDDDAIRTTMPQYDNPDDGIAALYKQGRLSAASKIYTQLLAQRKAKTAEFDAQIVSNQKALTMAGQIGSAISDQASLDTSRPALIATLTPVYGDSIKDLIPTTYDKDKIDHLVNAGMTATQRLTAEHNAATNMLAAYNAGAIANPYEVDPKTGRAALDSHGTPAGARWSENAQKADDHFLKSAVNTLSVAQTKEQVDAKLTLLHNMGVPDAILQQVPRFDAANVTAWQQSVAKLGLSGKEESDIAHQKVLEDQGKQRIANTKAAADARELRLTKDEAGGTGGKPLTATRGSELKEARHKADRTLEDWIRKPEQRNGKTGVFKIEQLTDEAKDEYVRQRLQIENDYRDATGMPNLETAAKAAVAAGDQKSYNVVKAKYENLTGGLRKLADVVPYAAPPPKTPDARRQRISSLTAEFNRTRDAARRKAIQDEIAHLTTPR